MELWKTLAIGLGTLSIVYSSPCALTKLKVELLAPVTDGMFHLS
jgi:hypothetical protein